MAMLATVLFSFTIVSLVGWVLIRVRRDRQSKVAASEGVAKQRKGIVWSDVAVGGCFAGSGLDAALRGEAEVDIAHVSGTNVRIAGALFFLLGLTLIVRTISKRNENRA